MKTFSVELEDNEGRLYFPQIQAYNKRDAKKRFKEERAIDAPLYRISELDNDGYPIIFIPAWRVTATNCHGGTTMQEFRTRAEAEEYYNTIPVNTRAVNQLSVFTSKQIKLVMVRPGGRKFKKSGNNQ